MDYAKAHIVTLWCAVIAKATRGVTKLLPKQMTPLQFRLLAQLTLPESERVLPMRAARLLVLKPADVDEAVGVLADRDLLQIHFQTDTGSARHLPERTEDTALGDIMHRGYTMFHGDP